MIPVTSFGLNPVVVSHFLRFPFPFFSSRHYFIYRSQFVSCIFFMCVCISVFVLFRSDLWIELYFVWEVFFTKLYTDADIWSFRRILTVLYLIGFNLDFSFHFFQLLFLWLSSESQRLWRSMMFRRISRFLICSTLVPDRKRFFLLSSFEDY